MVELEAERTSLKRLIQRLFDHQTYVSEADNCPGARACQLQVPSGETLKVLCLGGRTGGIAKLRTIAETASAEFLHHDGGKQEAFSRIEGLISRCHAVFCPVDCISHKACLYAKD